MSVIMLFADGRSRYRQNVVYFFRQQARPCTGHDERQRYLITSVNDGNTDDDSALNIEA